MSKPGVSSYSRVPGGQQAQRKRRGSLRALSVTLPGVTKRAFARRGLSSGELARQWPVIVGTELAGQCQPRKLRFPRPGETVDGNLTLRVAPAWALEIQHLETALLERINSFFGYRAVARLTLQQGPLAARKKTHGERQRRAAADPSPPTDAALAAKLSTVTDPELKEALERLGRSLRQKHAKRPGDP